MIVASELANRMLKKAIQNDPSLAADEARMADFGRRALRSPDMLATDDEDRALIELDRAVSQARREIDDELDAAYDADPSQPRQPSRLPRTRAALRRCLEIDPECYDALTLEALVDSETVEDALDALSALEPRALAWGERRTAELDAAHDDPWDAVYLRPWLRIRAKRADLLIQAACYRSALALCEEMLDYAPADGQGIRHTAALLYARLEDEEGLTALDVRFERAGSCWMHIARTALLYKLGRMDAARRAANGLAELCPGAAFYLAYPSYVPPYLPDRPAYVPGGEQESLFATYEADFLVVDTPELVTWALTLERFSAAAEAYGRSHGELLWGD